MTSNAKSGRPPKARCVLIRYIHPIPSREPVIHLRLKAEERKIAFRLCRDLEAAGYEASFSIAFPERTHLILETDAPIPVVTPFVLDYFEDFKCVEELPNQTVVISTAAGVQEQMTMREYDPRPASELPEIQRRVAADAA